MKGMDAVKDSVTQASKRIAKLLATGRIENDNNVDELRELLTRAEVLADEIRAREVMTSGERTEGAGATDPDSQSQSPEAR